jgi:hypothetical protein
MSARCASETGSWEFIAGRIDDRGQGLSFEVGGVYGGRYPQFAHVRVLEDVMGVLGVASIKR